MAGAERQRWRSDLVEAGVWISLVVAGWILCGQFGGQPLTMSRLGPEFWPRAVLLLILVAALGQLLAGYRARKAQERRAETHAASAPSPAADTPTEAQAGPLRVWAGFLLPVAWVGLMPGTGFYLATPVFVAAYLVLLGEHSPLRVMLVTAIVYAIAILVFTALLYVALPVGNWPGFYDFSNWLLSVIR